LARLLTLSILPILPILPISTAHAQSWKKQIDALI
jgi:hypothetical protein